MRRIGLAALGLFVMAGCVAAGGERYGRASGNSAYGYSDTQLDENRYRIQYRSSGERYLAEDFAMRRAAELTRQRGYDWFQVLNRSRAVSDDMFNRYDDYRFRNTGGSGDFRDRPAYGSGYDDDTVAVIDVIMGNNPAPNAGSVFDAARVLSYRPANGYGRQYP